MSADFDEKQDGRPRGFNRVLLCFAVDQEARYVTRPGMEILVTGMGRENAERAVHAALSRQAPQLVLTCGFAGGLNPGLKSGTVIFSADDDAGLSPRLLDAGATRVKFHCADRVAVTVEEKRSLRDETGADAVEMESGIIRAICRARGIPSATVRVISDSAGENLPLDFNAVMTADARIDYGKIIRSIVSSPGRIGGLLRLQRQCQIAAKNLAAVLRRVVPGPG